MQSIIHNDQVFKAMNPWQDGCSGYYCKIGNVVIIDCTIAKPDASWSLFVGVPYPSQSGSIIGTVNGHQVLVIQGDGGIGQIQIREGAFSGTFKMTGCYLAQ